LGTGVSELGPPGVVPDTPKSGNQLGTGVSEPLNPETPVPTGLDLGTIWGQGFQPFRGNRAKKRHNLGTTWGQGFQPFQTKTASKHFQNREPLGDRGFSRQFLLGQNLSTNTNSKENKPYAGQIYLC
jgi:hypothetical protein